MAIDLNDKTSNGNNLTNSGAAEYTADTPFAASTIAVDFEASESDYMSAGTSATLQPTDSFVIEFNIKPESTPASYANVVQSYSENTNHAGIIIGQLSTNKIQFISGRNTGNVEGSDFKNLTSTGTVPVGSWSHVACKWDNVEMEIVINGVSDSTVEWPNTPGYAATSYFRIGIRNVNGTQDFPFDGPIDDVRVWGTTRTNTEIANNRAVELIGNEVGLNAYWPFEALTPAATGGYMTTNTGYWGA